MKSFLKRRKAQVWITSKGVFVAAAFNRTQEQDCK